MLDTISTKVRAVSEALETTSPRIISAWVLAVSILAIVPMWLNYSIIPKDGAHFYVPVAELFLQGSFREAIFGPYYPMLLPLYEFSIFLMAKLTGVGLETSGRLVSALCFVLGGFGLFKLTEALFKIRLIAVLSLLLYLSNRELLKCSTVCMKETMLICLVAWGNYCMVKGLEAQQKAPMYVTGCLLFVAGGLVRSTALIFLFTWAFVWAVHKRQGVLWRLVLVALPIVAVITVYYLNIQEKLGLQVFRRSYALSSFVKYNFSLVEFGADAVIMMRQFLAKWYYLIAVFGAVGIYRLRRETYTRVFLSAFVVFFIICIIDGRVTVDRYIYAPVIALYPLAAYVLAQMLRSRRKIVQVIAILAVVTFLGLWTQKALTLPDPDRVSRKEAGAWILSQFGPKTDLVTNRQRVGFYADTTPFVIINFESLDNEKKNIARQLIYRKWATLADIGSQGVLHMVVAIDITHRDGVLLKEKLESWGFVPDRTFGNILVYLPKS